MGRKVGTILSFVAIILEVFVALFLTPLIIKSFGQAEYGVYTLVLSITAYLALLDLGVGHSVVKFISKYRANKQVEETQKFLGVTTVYFFSIALFAFLCGMIIYIFFPQIFGKGLSYDEIILAKKILIIAVLNICITLGTASFFYTVVAYENHLISKGLLILITAIRAIVSFILVKNGYRSVAVCAITTLSNFVFRLLVVFFVLFVMKIKPRLKATKSINIKEIIFFSSFVLLQMIAQQLNNVTDQVLIGMFVSSSSIILGIYGVGAQINTYFQSFGGALNGVLMPGVVRLVESGADKTQIRKEMSRIGRFNLMFVGLIWVVFLVLGKDFIVLWSGVENSQSYYVALFLMLPLVFIIVQNIGTQVLWAYNKHKKQAILKLIIVICNIGLTILLIKWNPLYGAVLGTFISLVFGDIVVMQIVFKKDIGISLMLYYKELFHGLLLSLLLTGVLGHIISYVPVNGWIGFIVKGSMMVAVFLALLFLVGFNDYERRLLKKISIKYLRIGRKKENV